MSVVGNTFVILGSIGAFWSTHWSSSRHFPSWFWPSGQAWSAAASQCLIAQCKSIERPLPSPRQHPEKTWARTREFNVSLWYQITWETFASPPLADSK
jgi:hypothetical protein